MFNKTFVIIFFIFILMKINEIHEKMKVLSANIDTHIHMYTTD